MGNHDAHPHLSAAERESLAERIALMDGVTIRQARRQIEDFLATDWGEPVAASAAADEPLPCCAT